MLDLLYTNHTIDQLHPEAIGVITTNLDKPSVHENNCFFGYFLCMSYGILAMCMSYGILVIRVYITSWKFAQQLLELKVRHHLLSACSPLTLAAKQGTKDSGMTPVARYRLVCSLRWWSLSAMSRIPA